LIHFYKRKNKSINYNVKINKDVQTILQ
jgi:hypothetical protein